MTDYHDQIRERLDEVDRLILDREGSLAHLRGEREELVTAIRVMKRFGADEAELPLPPLPESLAKEGGPEKPEKRKPPGIPTMAEMVTEVLAERTLLDDHGLTPREITEEIRKRWWWDAPSESISPIVWRMWKIDQRLIKDGGLYALPRNETPAGETAGASEPGGRSGPLFVNPPQ